MKILLAFDKYKDSMSAQKACDIASESILRINPDFQVISAPLTDGGEGFCEILTSTAGGTIERHTVDGSLLEPLKAVIGYVDIESLAQSVRSMLQLPDNGSLAIVEMAQASGLESVPIDQRNPRQTSTRGTGQLMRLAAEKEVDAILLGIGGSATNDIAIGALEAMGLSCLDTEGKPVEKSTPADWAKIQSLKTDDLIDMPAIRIACDVTNPLLGPKGATAIYGPQKGLLPDDKADFESDIARVAGMLCDIFNQDSDLPNSPSTGAAGGMGFGLKCAYDAVFIPGFNLVEEWLQLNQKIREADIVISGEGRFDESSLSGKGPGSVLETARHCGTKFLAFPGSMQDDIVSMFAKDSLVKIIPISAPDTPIESALKEGPKSLEQKITSLAESFKA